MDYKMNLAKRMLFNKRGSLIAAVLAVMVGILVIHVNFVIFQGLFDAIVRDITEYETGDVQITDEEDFIDETTKVLGWLEQMPAVEAAAPRLSGTGMLELSKLGVTTEVTRVPLFGVDPVRDVRASTAHETIVDGQFVYSRNSMVVGASVADDFPDMQVGDSVTLEITDRYGEEKSRRFIISGIANTPGSQGFDYSAAVHIDALRDMQGRSGESTSIMVRVHDKAMSNEVREAFLAAFDPDDYNAETVEEAAEERLAGFRSGIAMINMIGYFGMMSSAFAIVTIQMMLVNGKTREIGIMRSIGAKRKDIMVMFLLQGMLIGAIGAGVGTGAGLAYTVYAKETNLTFAGSIPLEVSYNWEKIIQTAVTAFVLAIIAALYPSYRATKMLPVEAMRGV